MPLTELIRYFNTADSADGSMLYPEGERAAAWWNGLRLRSLFQPIVDLHEERIVGHRASLSAVRDDGAIVTSDDAYALCAEASAVVRFDRLCRTLHALNFLAQRKYTGGYLQVSVHPRHVLAVPSQHGLVYEAILKRCGLAPQDIVFDIDVPAPGDTACLPALDNYRRRGYRLALHSPCVGDSTAGLLTWQPEIVRLSGCSVDAVALAKLAGVASEVGGIDSGADLAQARAAGIDLAFGELFGSPQPDCRPTHSKVGVAYNSSSPIGVSP